MIVLGGRRNATDGCMGMLLAGLYLTKPALKRFAALCVNKLVKHTIVYTTTSGVSYNFTKRRPFVTTWVACAFVLSAGLDNVIPPP
jgi:hypothetical protein